MPEKVRTSQICRLKNGPETQTFFSVNILFTSMTPQTRTSKGLLNPGTCEHPLQIGALFTFLYLFSTPYFSKKCEQTIPKPSKKCDEYTLFHASRTFMLITPFLFNGIFKAINGTDSNRLYG